MAGKHTQKKKPEATAKNKAERRERYGGQVYVDPVPEAETPVRRRVETPSRYEYERARGTEKTRKLSLKWAIPVVAVLLVVLIALGVLMFQTMKISRINTIYPNITVNGIDIGGLTVEEAAEKLDAEGADIYKDKSVTVLLPMDRSVTVTAEELALGGNTVVAAEAAYAYGRGGSLLENMKSYRACQQQPVAMSWEVNNQPDEKALLDKVAPVAAEVNAQLLETEAEIGETFVTIIKGVGAASVDAQEVCQLVMQAFARQEYDTIEYEMEEVDPESGQQVLEAVYDAVHKEPVNAMYDKATGGATESEQGVSFDMEEALRLWDETESGGEIVIPLVFTDPEIDSETLLARLFADCLAEKSTSLSGSSSNRINNVDLAAQALNNVVVNPGETFDYNSCLGERTTSKGYKEAGAYSGGKHVQNVGGGICQNSSTLYYCALYANLDITVRDCHYFTVSYLPRGLDATVSWGGPDFRFINDREYPIKIKAWVSNGYLTVQIWGTDVDGSYVEMYSDTWEDEEYYYARTYRAVYDADGNRLSYNEEAYSRYHKYEADEEPTETPAPTNTPEVTSTPEPTNTPAPTDPPPTEVPPTEAPPTEVPPTEAPPTEVPPTEVPPTEVPPTEVPPTEVPPTEVPPTEAPPTEVPPTEVPPTEVPPTEALPQQDPDDAADGEELPVGDTE